MLGQTLVSGVPGTTTGIDVSRGRVECRVTTFYKNENLACTSIPTQVGIQTLEVVSPAPGPGHPVCIVVHFIHFNRHEGVQSTTTTYITILPYKRVG